jgi:DNA-binding LacI/PurR family transcriptional regulator
MLTTVEQQGERVGEEAVNIPIGHVEGNIPMDHVEKRIVRTRLILRGTTR